MKIGYATIYDSSSDASGFGSINRVGHYIRQSLQLEDSTVVPLGPLHETYGLPLKGKTWFIRKFVHKTYNRHREKLACRDYGKQLAAKLRDSDIDAVVSPVSPGSQPVAYLECKQPIAIWTDSTLASAVDAYPSLRWDSSIRSNLQAGLDNERAALERAALAIYPSTWAADEAKRQYQLPDAKVKVVPFGANLDSTRSVADVDRLIESREFTTCRLLYLGLEWIRKGGDIVLAAAEKMIAAGVPTELTIVGCDPFQGRSKPSFVNVEGLLRRQVPDQRDKLDAIFGRSHFLFTPSRAEAYGHVFAEASSFGVPSISTNVGGIPSVVVDGVNGRTFPLDTAPSMYADAIAELFANPDAYRALARSSFERYRTTLDWAVGGRQVLSLLRALPTISK